MLSSAALCLAMNIYHEARGEPMLGKQLVADSVLNRVQRKQWPNTVCEVVFQKHQYSWTEYDLPHDDKKAFNESMLIAQLALNNGVQSCVDHYHNDTVQPYWASAYEVHSTVGGHTFYCSEK